MITEKGLQLSKDLGLEIPAEMHLASILARHIETYKRTVSELHKGPEHFAEIPDMFYAKRKGALARMESLIFYWLCELDIQNDCELSLDPEIGSVEIVFKGKRTIQ